MHCFSIMALLTTPTTKHCIGLIWVCIFCIGCGVINNNITPKPASFALSSSGLTAQVDVEPKQIQLGQPWTITNQVFIIPAKLQTATKLVMKVEYPAFVTIVAGQAEIDIPLITNSHVYTHQVTLMTDHIDYIDIITTSATLLYANGQTDTEGDAWYIMPDGNTVTFDTHIPAKQTGVTIVPLGDLKQP